MQRYQLTRRNQPVYYEYYPRLPRLGAICNCSSPSFPRIFVSEPPPLPLLMLYIYIYSFFHLRPPPPPRLINLSSSPRIPSPPDTCHSLFIIPCSFPPLSFVPVSLARSIITGGGGRGGRERGRELGVIRSTMANGHKLASKTVALDPAGFTPLYKPGVRSLN